MSQALPAGGDNEGYSAFIVAAKRLGVTMISGEPLARHTTFRIGGPADLFAAADEIDTLESLANLATSHGIPVTVLGGGSNVLISDRGVRGLVIANQTRKIGMSESAAVMTEGSEQPSEAGGQPATRGSYLVADSGVALAGMARWAIREGWSGLEWAVSIPGTVGGAVIGNAGAYGGQIADNLAWVLVAEPGSGRQVITADRLEYRYRDSALKRRLASASLPSVVMRVGFRLVPGSEEEMAARADSFLARRRASQPVEPSAGSVFRNPPGDHAGRLIEAVGLKGYRVGGVQVSPRHANFIVNTGDGRAVEVAELIRLIRQRVHESTGIDLAPEILYLGDWTGSA
jgi:UDP-N-acetylmuramate dehydrogenase